MPVDREEQKKVRVKGQSEKFLYQFYTDSTSIEIQTVSYSQHKREHREMVFS